MNIEELKNYLVNDLKPKKTLASTKTQLFRYVIFCSSIILLFSYFVGVREDIEYSSKNTTYYLELLTLILLPLVTAYNALTVSIPGRSGRSSIIIYSLILITWSFIVLNNYGNTNDSNPEEPHYYCTTLVVISTILFGFVLGGMISNNYPTKLTYNYFIALLSSSSTGALILHLVCPRESFYHLFLWHYLPVLLIPFLGLSLLFYYSRNKAI